MPMWVAEGAGMHGMVIGNNRVLWVIKEGTRLGSESLFKIVSLVLLIGAHQVFDKMVERNLYLNFGKSKIWE